MCGICGIVAIDANDPIDGEALKRMNAAMAHRGPDGEGIWMSENGRSGFGHKRLAIIDLSEDGHQPMSTPEGDVIVTFNGEIYNYQDIREKLIKQGHDVRTKTDTETLLHLYREYGENMVDHLDGDFAFGLWDNKKQQLMLVRDRMGVKPLYYAFSNGFLLFASEIKAILASGLIEKRVDEEALYHYMTYLVTPPGMTMVQGVKKLKTGTMMLTGPDATAVKKQYWSALPGQVDVDIKDLDAQFEELFQRAVDKRTMSDVPLGVLFSGGVDSTLNAAAFGKSIAPNSVRTFTVGMKGTEQDESVQAAEMSKLLGTEHYEVQITDQIVLDNLDKIILAQDEPISDPVCLPLYFVSELARSKGTVVLQAGEGADEAFCGYGSYIKYLKMNEYWEKMARLPSFVPNTLSYGLGLFKGRSPICAKTADMMKRMAKGQEFFMSSAIGFYDTEKSNVLSGSFMGAHSDLNSYDAVAPFYEYLEEHAPNASFLQKMSFIEMNLRLPELLLMRVDKMSMAHSLEVRVPFLDHKLIEFAMSVPQSFKLRDGVPKEPVKRLAANYVGREKIYRQKKGFGAPIKQWFNGRLKDSFFDLLSDQATNAEQYFDTEYLKKTLNAGVQTQNQAFQLWVVYNFLKWKNLVL